MRPLHGLNGRCAAALCAGFVLCVTALVSGAVIDTQASISTTVQELLDGSPGSVTSDQDQLLSGGTNLPLLATGNVGTTDLEGTLIATGQAFAALTEPLLGGETNPEEFTLEVSSYANGDTASYAVDAEAVESRTVLFARDGNPLADPDFDFGLSSTRRVESRIFLSGAIVFWSTQAGLSLENMLGEFSLQVTRDDTGATLFSTFLSVAGQDANSVTPTSGGPLQFSVVTIDDLRGEGVDESSLAILEQVEAGGTLIVLAIPEQEHPYTYTVTADEQFVLTATLRATAHNVPGGTGVAVTLGGPFENLADFMAQGLSGVDGAGVERSINAITVSRKIGFVPASTHMSGGSMCGAFGAEMIPIVVVGLFATLLRRRW